VPDFLESLRPLLQWLLRTSVQASTLVGLVLLVQWVFRRRISAGWRYGLWMLVLVRLMLPAAPRSGLSLFNVLPSGLLDVDRTEQVAAAPHRPAPAGRAEPETAPLTPGGIAPPALAASESPRIEPVAPVEPAFPAASAGGSPPRQAAASRERTLAGWVQVALAAAWLAGMAALLMRIAVIDLVMAVRLRGLAAREDPQILHLLAECKAVMGVRSSPRVIETSTVTGPALAGLLRPRLLLPPGMIERLTPAELRFVFLHELGHMKRRDVAVNWLTSVLAAIHWFNPILWLAFARMRGDRELACDAMVLSRTSRREGLHYGHTIVKLLERVSGHGARPGVVGVLEDKRQIRRRITMIASFHRGARGRAVLGIALLLALGVLSLTDAPAGGAADKPAANPAPIAKAEKAAPAKAGPGKVASDADARARKALQANVGGLDFVGTPFGEAIEFLRTVSGANMHVNWRALKDPGIDEATEIKNVKLKGVTVEKALQVILADVGPPDIELGFVVDEGVVTISTRVDLARRTVTRVYDVRDLITGAFATAGTEVATGTPAAANLIGIITEAVGSNSWRPLGNTGSINEKDGQFIITQSAMNHELVEALLGQLREARFPEWKQEIHRKLQAPIADLRFENIEFKDVLQFVTEVAGVNIVLDPAADKLPPITFRAEKLTAEQALGLVTRMAKLQWQMANGVVYVSRKDAAPAGPKVAPPGMASGHYGPPMPGGPAGPGR